MLPIGQLDKRDALGDVDDLLGPFGVADGTGDCCLLGPEILTRDETRGIVGAAVDAERDLMAKITRLRELKERAGVLKEVITSMVKPGGGE